MKALREPMRFLDRDEMETVHRNALRILAQVGMRIDHEGALAALRDFGCRVDAAARHVLFPEALVQQCVDRMRAAFSTRETPERMAVRYSHVRFRREPFTVHPDFSVSAGGYCVFILDRKGVRRPATLQDTREALRLAHQLDQITYTGLPVAAQDVPLPIRQVRMAAELVKATDKLGGIEALTPFDIEYIGRIGEVVRGSREALRRAPILIGYAEARSPLCLDRAMAEVMIEYVRQGFPQSLDTMPNAGATAPMNPAGTLALGVAETLGGVVLAQAIDENAVVTVDLTPSVADMVTGIFKYAGAERASLLGARIQMVSEFYGCPSGVHGGKTDSCLPDVRCGVEKGVSMLMPVLCGAVGFGTVGHLENAVTFSPLQLVLDNEVARYVRRAVTGFTVSDAAVDVEQIRRVGIGGNYLCEPETAGGFREVLNLSPFFAVHPWGSAPRADDSRHWQRLAQERVNELLAEETPPVLTEDQEKAVDAIVAEAEKALRKRGLL
jgi:trimethylamine--corrinoid protein Co-methyltransferase